MVLVCSNNLQKMTNPGDPKLPEKGKKLFAPRGVRTWDLEGSKKVYLFEQRSRPLGHGGTVLKYARKGLFIVLERWIRVTSLEQVGNCELFHLKLHTCIIGIV